MSLLARDHNVHSETTPSNLNWLILLILHIPLALVMYRSEAISTIHAVVTLIIGVFFALRKCEPNKVAMVAAYIIGSEVLWRMTNANIFWEFGKYATVLILGLSFLSINKRSSSTSPLLYFILLCLSIPLTLVDLNLSDAREEISFNLSGPLCLAVSIMFFRQIELNSAQRRKIIWLITAPLIGIITISAYRIYAAGQIVFTENSNFITSGGFGPNQVSAILSLGALLLFLLALQERRFFSRIIPLIISLGMLTFSMLTFSRGGLYNFGAALLAMAIMSITNAKIRSVFLGLAFLGFVIIGLVIYPQLNEYTNGKFESRFSSMNTTGRLDIMQEEIEFWLEKPILGAGPGMGKYYSYNISGRMIAAHTEYTRMLSEHGIPGIFAMLLLIVLSAKALHQVPSGFHRVWTASLIAWSLVEMTHAAMRIAAIGFIFGLAMSLYLIKETTKDSEVVPARSFPYRTR